MHKTSKQTTETQQPSPLALREPHWETLLEWDAESPDRVHSVLLTLKLPSSQILLHIELKVDITKRQMTDQKPSR